VIILTRLGGRQLAVNPDLIERAETTPDTVITMVDGHKLVVVEALDEVVDAVRTWRASVAAEAYGMSSRVESSGSGSSAQGVAAHSALGTPLARVLRMPQREE